MCGGGVALEQLAGGDKEASCAPPEGAHVQEEDAEDGVHLSWYVWWPTCESHRPSWSILVWPSEPLTGQPHIPIR
jgi:hypothetical protein